MLYEVITDITTDTKGHITLIALPDGKKVYYEYSGNNLVKYYDIAGDVTVYEYDNEGRMTVWYDKEGQRQVYNVYDDEDRVIEQWDANGYHYTLEYNENHVLRITSYNVCYTKLLRYRKYYENKVKVFGVRSNN